LVRQSAKRRTAPTILTPAEIKALLDVLDFRERALAFLAASTGLRQSELFGLKWKDVDFAGGTMNVTRSIAYGVVVPCKTESSQKPVPIHPLLSETLEQWRKLCCYNKPDDWIFASKCRRGRKPYWGQAILRRYIRPAALDLLRHSSLRSTLDIYTQAITPAKHAAQAAVLSLVFSSETNGTQSSGSGEAAV
jgi:integrase